MGGGYVTRLLAGAVGPSGKVYAFQPAEFIAFKKQYGDDQAAVDAAHANVDAVSGSFAAPPFPEPLDTIITVQNFHDLYLKPFPEGTGDKASAALFAALKPGRSYEPTPELQALRRKSYEVFSQKKKR